MTSPPECDRELTQPLPRPTPRIPEFRPTLEEPTIDPEVGELAEGRLHDGLVYQEDGGAIDLGAAGDGMVDAWSLRRLLTDLPSVRQQLDELPDQRTGPPAALQIGR